MLILHTMNTIFLNYCVHFFSFNFLLVFMSQCHLHLSRCLVYEDNLFIASVQVKIIGVEPSDANAMALSLHHDQRVMLDQVGGFADGVAVKEVGEETFRLCRSLVDGIVLVSRDSICASIKVRFLSCLRACI